MMRRVSSRLATAAWRCQTHTSFLGFVSPRAFWVEGRRYSSTAVPTPRLSTAAAIAAITAVEEQVRRRSADVAAVAKYLALSKPRAPLPPLPNNADDTTRVLWSKRTWTYKDLQDVEQRLDRVKQDLRDAKQDLDRAKQDFRQNSDPAPSVSTAIQRHVKKYSTAPLKLHPLDFDTRIGTETAGLQLFRCFQRIAGVQRSFTKQDTIAAALLGASGVGKTYFALTYPSGGVRRAYEADGIKHVTIYTGFNFTSPLTEEEYLKLFPDSDAVAVVVLGRVVAGLVVALNNIKVLDRSSHVDVHRVAENLNSESLLLTNAKPTMNALMKKAVDLLLQLEQKYLKKDEKLLTVLLNIDEAQELDELVPSGGRYALRCLRQLQHLLKERTSRTVVMGFATGIDPQLWLNTQTAGCNETVDGRLTTKDDFYKIAEAVCRSHNNAWDRVHKVAAALLYPRVRNMIKCMSGSKDEKQSEIAVISDAATVSALMEAFIMDEPIPYSSIPPWCVHDNRKTHEAVPFFDGAVWQKILRVLGVKMDLNNVPTITSVLRAEDDTAAYFESTTFHTLSLLIALFYQPGSSLRISKEAAHHFRTHQGTMLSLALGIKNNESVSTTNASFVNFPYDKKKGNYLPFDGTTGGLEKAMKRGLFEEFEEKVKDIKADGEAALFYCGGDAPFDYIMVRRVGKQLKIAYMDAKYKSDPSQTVSTDVKELAEKAPRVHQSLCGHLDDVAVKYSVCIITNARLSDVMLRHVKKHKVSVLCPSTFAFSPVSDIMYLGSE